VDDSPPVDDSVERDSIIGGGTITSVKRDASTAAEAAEAVRVARLREDARRPLSVNLAETIALSHALLKMAGAAQRR